MHLALVTSDTPKPTAEARKQISEQIGMDSRSVQASTGDESLDLT